MAKLSLLGRLISGAAALLVLVGLLAGMLYFHASSGVHAASIAPLESLMPNPCPQ